MWTPLRIEIEKIRHNFSITDAQFTPIALNEWQAVERSIFDKFVKTGPGRQLPVWLWGNFKMDSYALQIKSPGGILSELIDQDELVWFFVNETVDEKDKFWYYRGFVKYIEVIINEAQSLDELNWVSKKFEWMICFNHHNFLIATGSQMPEKLKAIVDVS